MKRKLTALLLAMTFVFATVAPTVANGSAKVSANKTATVSVEKSKKEKSKFGSIIDKLTAPVKSMRKTEGSRETIKKTLKASETTDDETQADDTTTLTKKQKTFEIPFTVRNKSDKDVDGAEAEIIDKGDQTVKKEWTSGATPFVFSLKAGTYSFKLRTVPMGYKYENSIDFKIDEDGKITVADDHMKKIDGEDTIVMVLENEVGKTFFGIEDKLGNRVTGAMLQIMDKDSEKVIHQWPSDTRYKNYILPNGNYVLLQSEAPEGYEKADHIEFTITEDGKIETKSARLKTSDSNNDQYLLLEAKKETGKLFFSLRDMAGKELSGAKLKIVKITEKDADKETEELVKEWTSGNESVPYKLEKGKYKFVVEGLPDDCAVEKSSIDFEINEKGEIEVAEADKGNVEAKDGNQTLFMVAERLGDRIYFGLEDSYGKALSGLELKIEGNNGKVINLVSGEGSIGVKVTDLPDGTYVFSQTNVRYGHEAAEPIRFTVKDGKVVEASSGLVTLAKYQELTLVSKNISSNSVKRVVTFSRVDSLGKLLIGTEIEIYKDGTKIASWKSGSDNHKLELEAGVYKYHEASIVLGHKIAKDFEFEVKADGSIILKGVQLGEVVKLKEGGHICVGEPTSKPVEDPNKKPGENSGQKPTTDTKTQAKNHWVEFNVAKKDGTLLDGAVVEIYKNGKLLESWTTSTTGYKTQLEPGTYRFHTKTAPKGYQLARDFNFGVNRDGTITLGKLQSGDTVTAKAGKIIVYGDPVSATGARINTTGTTSAAPGNGRLPKTGDGISPVVYAVGLAAVGAVILGIGIKKRRESVDEVK